MKIELVYPERCAHGTILYVPQPVEEIRVHREIRQYGGDKVSKVSHTSFELHVGRGGEVELELTKINANFIKYAVGAGLLQYVVEEQAELVETMFKAKPKKEKAVDPADELAEEKDTALPKSKVVTV
jgi:predicted translin family RNA/ssDNA-binding protein